MERLINSFLATLAMFVLMAIAGGILFAIFVYGGLIGYTAFAFCIFWCLAYSYLGE